MHSIPAASVVLPCRYWVYSPLQKMCWLSSSIPSRFTSYAPSMDRDRGPRCSTYRLPPSPPESPPPPPGCDVFYNSDVLGGSDNGFTNMLDGGRQNTATTKDYITACYNSIAYCQ